MIGAHMVEEMQRTGEAYTTPLGDEPEVGIMSVRPVQLGAVQAWIVVQKPQVPDVEAEPFVYDVFRPAG